MNTVGQDIRYGLRMLWKHRLATLVCTVALALGIGANTAMFSVAEAFLLHTVPIEKLDGMVALVDSRPQQNIEENAVAPATFHDWQKQTRSFERLAAYSWDEVNLTGDREPQKIQAFQVSAYFFEMLGVQPQLGRTFLPEEDAPGKEQEIILGHGLWERRYAADPAILGKTVKVDGRSFTIVGVMGKGFDYPMPAEAWLPLGLTARQRERRDVRYLWVLGRLMPGTSLAQAAAEMNTITERQAKAYPDTNKGWQLRVLPIREFASGSLTRQYTFLLLGAVAFVLLIACADVANVQFARVTGRTKEFAVRTALGGNRWRLIRQLLTESVLLSLGGAGLGLFLAQWDLELIRVNMPPDVAKFIAGWKTIRLDAGAFLFTMGIAVTSGLLSGIGPSLLGTRANLSETLKESGRGSSAGRSRHRLRSALVVLEVSLALILLVGAGLLVKGFRGLLAVNESYSPETLLTLNLTLPELQYATPSAREAFHANLQQRLGSLPGVVSAAMATYVPYSNGGGASMNDFSIEGRAPGRRGELQNAIVETVSPNYLPMMKIGLRDGRPFTDSDGSNTQPVALISQSLARRYFSGENPLGRRIKVGRPDADRPWMTVVGIVDDLHYSWITKDFVPTLYRPYRQAPPFYTTLVLRTAGDPLQAVSAVRAAAAAVDPDLPLFNIKPMDRLILESVVGIAYVAAMMAVLGLIALVLASVGVYGVMSYLVSERLHEIGVRMALGATPKDIFRLVLGSGMFLTLVGIGIGLPVAFALAFALSSLLFGVTAADPAVFLGLPVLLAAVAALACYLPARRAVSVDPLASLRYE